MTARPGEHVQVQIAATGQTGTIDPADRDRWFHPDDGSDARRLGGKEQINFLLPGRNLTPPASVEVDR